MIPFKEQRCSNCKYQSRLILWEYNSYGDYKPNYDRPLTCCTALVRLNDGSNTVYGETAVDRNGMCEMWTPKDGDYE